eukprot:GEMP01024593.1.p1 GENE.GEMP01024593.1~~GEMP01024593.1.p1  ORF type:complete len:334 (-),score=70.23 GEMP01024593.1:1420-2421(-)
MWALKPYPNKAAHAARHFFGSVRPKSSNTPAAPLGYRGRVEKFHLGIAVVPQQTVWVIERFGKFHQMLEGGLHFLIPFVDRISYIHSLKEEAIIIPNQQAITKDNVFVTIDGVLYVQIEDAHNASYGVHDPIFALMQLAQTTMRSELGKITLDRTFEERVLLNRSIVEAMNEASSGWGIKCKRYEIRDIVPPESIRSAMEMQAEAERRRRADVLQSEGEKTVEVNLAEAKKAAAILHAEGEAESTRKKADAVAHGLQVVAEIVSSEKGRGAASLRVAEQWIHSWEQLAKKGGQTLIVPANINDAASMTAQAMSIYKSLNNSPAKIDDAEIKKV